jgi:hypothetical protein
MRKALFAGLMIVLAALVFDQSVSRHELGTIPVVKPHESTNSSGWSPTAYDISKPVSNTVYTVLYMPSPGTYGAEYSEERSVI